MGSPCGKRRSWRHRGPRFPDNAKLTPWPSAGSQHRLAQSSADLWSSMDDGSSHCRSVRIGICDGDGSQMLVIRRSCVVCAARLAGALWGSRNGKTRPRSSHRCARYRLFRRRVTGARRRGRACPGREARAAAFGGPTAAGWSSREIMLSIEPVAAGPTSCVLPLLATCGSLTDGIAFCSLMALTLGGSVGETEPSNMLR